MGSHKHNNAQITKQKTYWFKSTKTAIKNNKSVQEKQVAQKQYSFTSSLIDKLAQKNIIHKNKANRFKRKLQHYINLYMIR
ncbi:30S ribosomal protein S20 [Candidatus Karelsulcia muelleri]